MASLENAVRTALAVVRDEPRGDIVTLGMVQGLQIEEGAVQFSLLVDPARGSVLEPLRQAAERAVAAVAGVRSVTAVLTAERKSPPAAAKMDPHGMAKNPPLDLPIRRIIAVASGKGGVGKSTVAFNLAVALAQAGYGTGLLDADIYGPSIPLITGVGARKPEQRDGMLIPLQAHGLKLMSIGFMVDGEAPLVWRGPMVQTALYQMLRDVEWGTAAAPLDFLIVDMPPGTGDAQLTLAQKVPVSGAIIVSTPQDLALIDARKAIEMFRKVQVPVLGLIENMSTYICANCGHEEHIFGHGGAAAEAAKQGVPFLGAIPLLSDIRDRSDRGLPLINKEISYMYKQMTDQLATMLT